MTRPKTRHPYERLFPLSALAARRAAKSIIDRGWKLSKYPMVSLEDPMLWRPRSDRERPFEFHLQCLDPVNPLLIAYEDSGDGMYLAAALGLAKSWVRHHLNGRSQTLSRFAWYDMAVGLRAHRLAYIIDAAEQDNMLSGGEMSPLWNALELHARHLMDEKNITHHNNHGYYQIAGQLAMGRRFADRSSLMYESAELGLRRLEKIVHEHFTSEGVHREHSPDYHRMVYEALRALIDCGLVVSDDLIRFADSIEDSLSWFVFPDGRIVNFGDTDFRRIQEGFVKTGRQLWRTDAMRFWASRGHAGRAPEECVKALVESGYWVVRETRKDPKDVARYSYLAFNCAFHSRTHKHADDLSFVWYDRGGHILVDAGRYGYIGKTAVGSRLWREGHWYSDPMRIYCESTRAHNALEFDDKDYARRGVKPYGSALRRAGKDAHGGVYFAEGECRHFRSIRHMRALYFRPGDWLIVHDWFRDNDGRPHAVKQWFHLAPELTVKRQGQVYLCDGPILETPLRILPLLPGADAIEPILGQEKPLQGWFSPLEKTRLPNYALAYQVDNAACANIATLFVFGEDTAVDTEMTRCAESGRKGRFAWRDGRGLHLLDFHRPATGDVELAYRVKPRSTGAKPK